MQVLPAVPPDTGDPAARGARRLRVGLQAVMPGRRRPRAIALACMLLLGLACASMAVRADDLSEVQALVRQGDLVQASERLDAYLARNPKDARGRFLRGLILTGQQRPADAIGVFRALTDDYPELPEPYNNLAVLYAAQGQLDRARQLLESAIRAHPSYATAHENLGDVYARMASDAYSRALQLDRSNASVQTKLTLIRDLLATDGGVKRPAASSRIPGPSSPASAAHDRLARVQAADRRHVGQEQEQAGQ